jgi:drug/metabolite transporter (DMT)-like permease
MKRIYADLVLLSIALIWGITFPVIKIALDSISPFAFNTIRFFTAVVLFLPFILTNKNFSVRDVKTGMLIGVVVFLGYSFQTVGIEFTSATNAGFITSTYVVFTPIIAFLFFKVRITTEEILFITTTFLGLYLLSGYSGYFNFGDFLIMLCAVAFAVEIVIISHFSKIKNPLSLAFGQVLAVAVFSAPLSLPSSKFNLNNEVLTSLLITAVFATTLARIGQNYAQKFTRSTDTAVIFSMEGVFAHIFSVFILGESLSFMQYLGAGLIILSVIGISLLESNLER